MRLAETALSAEGLPEPANARALRQAFIVGHAYAAALDGMRTPQSWKLLVRAVTGGAPLSAPMLGSEAGGVGVDMVDVAVDSSEYLAAESDWDQRRVLLHWLHSGSVTIARAQGWDLGPFESALAAVAADPEFRIAGPWKARAGKAKARLVVTETLEGVSAAIETEGRGGGAVHLELEAAWIARKSLSDPRWFDGAWVVRDNADRVVLRAEG